MSAQVNDLLDRASIIIQDTTETRWTHDELLKWMNDGQREIVLLKPDSNVVNEAFLLAEDTKQSIPNSGVSFIDLVRNLGEDGETPGKPIRLIKRHIMDEQYPNWHYSESSKIIKHYIIDDRDPTRFYVFPKPDENVHAELVYAAVPTDCSLGGEIKINSIYANALLDYILYRAYQKDADYGVNRDSAMMVYQSFRNSLGLKSQIEVLDNPYIRRRFGPTSGSPTGVAQG